MKYFSFNKELKLKKKDFKLSNYLKKKNSKYFYIFYTNRNIKFPRIGILIEKKYIKYSNKRNLIKRIIRESFRINKYNIYKLDYIIKLNNKLNLINKFNLLNDINSIWNIFNLSNLL